MKNRNFKSYLHNERKMENREHKDYFKEVAERTKKEQIIQLFPSNKTIMIGIDTLKKFNKEELSYFLEELKKLDISVTITPGGDSDSVKEFFDEYKNLITINDETNDF